MIEQVEKGNAYDEVRDAVHEETEAIRELGHRRRLVCLHDNQRTKNWSNKEAAKLNEHC